MFWNIFLNLCAKNSTNPSAVCKNLGLSNATATHWKQGSQPNSATLAKLADYFNVTIEYFIKEPDQKEKSPSGIPDRLLKELSENPAKLELALLICDWDDDKLDRALKLLDASLLLPKEDQPS